MTDPVGGNLDVDAHNAGELSINNSIISNSAMSAARLPSYDSQR